MKLFVPEEIDEYAHAHTRPLGPLFEELRDYTQANVSYSQMQVGRVEGSLLKMLASLVSARRVLELGTYTGYSSLCMAEALPDDGKLITCDYSEEYTAVARRFFAKSPHGHKIELRMGDALATVEALDEEPFDMAFVDADKERYPLYYEAILPRIRTGGLMVFDNVLWSGAALDPQEGSDRGIAALNDRVQNDPAVDNVMLTVRDGILLARKR